MPEASSTGPGQGRAIRNANGKRGGAPLYIAAAAAARRRRRFSDFCGLAAAATLLKPTFCYISHRRNSFLDCENYFDQIRM